MRYFPLISLASLGVLVLSACGDVPPDAQEESASTSEGVTVGIRPAQVVLGYQLYWDGELVGQALDWTRAKGASNCKWNFNRYPQKKVECYYNGKPLGYELFWDGNRVGYEPEWFESNGIGNCAWNRATYPNKRVRCLYDGEPVLAPIPAPTCSGDATYIVRTENGECQSVTGWNTCPLDPNASSASRLCVYRFSGGQPSEPNMAQLTAIAASRWNPTFNPEPHALGMCGAARPTCSSPPPAPLTKPPVTCDPEASAACCKGIGGQYDPNAPKGDRCRVPSDGMGKCPDCSGFGIVGDRVLTVVLDPLKADKSEYYVDLSTDDQPAPIMLRPPEGEQVFSVLVDTQLPDGTVATIR